MAGNIRKKEKVTKEYEDEFEDFDFQEIDINEILGENEKKSVPNSSNENAKKTNKKRNKTEAIDKKEEPTDALQSFFTEDELEKKEKKNSKEENILEFVPKDFMEIEKDLKEEPKKRGRKKKIDKVVEELKDNKLRILKETKTTKKSSTKENNKEIKMELDDEQNEMTVTLKNKKCRLDILPEEYDIYTNNAKSYIIVRQEKLNLIFKDGYLRIEKKDRTYTVETDENIKLDYIVCDIIKSENNIAFTVENLAGIEINENDIRLIIDEVKVAESRVEDNKTLIISEEDGKVFLPYTKEEVLMEVQRTKNANIEEIIENKYTRPINMYKNSIRSRFSEAYKLMYEREEQSRNKAFMLGLELMFEFNLHPAIISACKNLEELDIYLDCLEDNELEKFSCFKIIYKAMPMIRKRAKTHNF